MSLTMHQLLRDFSNKAVAIIAVLCCVGLTSLQAQIDRNTGGILIKAEENKEAENSSLRSKTSPSLSKTNNGFTVLPKSESSISKDDSKKMVDMTPQKSKFIDQRYDIQPKWSEENFPVEEVFTGDRNLGTIKTTSKYVEVFFRDYGNVDGDIIQVYLNKELVEGNITLSGGYKVMLIDIKPGISILDFKAVSMGLFAPNTAELKVIDSSGHVVMDRYWSLATGNKATIQLVR
ncbi:MAG: hypothetical protein CL818_08835 [Croceibacter sp.]|jgi:hypothetical protein|uniref:hypothetical protein n=2 Tax=Flavobacteriaceae TaxID=49546 RepID=UPI000C64A8B2|nr:MULTISPECIES: hypothetical protein [Croceibacter]MBG26163.1 hypothetical protein [Croceibacter sp.]HAT70211.1 hypothetical protein [Flavobacteriaceae bacterium]|tara:strand:- start:2517 stop:3215 length:699 start_codon:yes stop_codon:yes gene_type:complete